MIRRLSSAVAMSALLAAPALADTWTVDKAHSDVSFQIRHLMSRVRGSFTDFSGTVVADAARPEAATVEFTVKAASIDTANENRDNDLRGENFFDVARHPDITFKSTRVKAAGKDRYDVTGILTLHGVSREVTLPVEFHGFGKDLRGNEKAGFSTDFTVKRGDYGLVWNKTLETGGLLLGDEVAVSVNLEMNKQKAPATD